MIQNRDKPTFLCKLYPNTKLWLALALSTSVILFNSYIYSIAILILSMIVIIAEKFILEFKIVFFAILIMAISMFGINGTLNPVIDYSQPPVFVLPLLGWNFYKDGLLYAADYFLRIAPLMAALFLLFRTINMSDLGASITNAGVPYRFSFMFISTFQIIPIMGKDMNQIMDAQRARGLDTEGSLWKRFKAFIPVIVPMVANSIMKVQDQAIAMETKGFNSKADKTVYRNLTYTTADKVIKWLSILTIIISIAYAVLKGLKII